MEQKEENNIQIENTDNKEDKEEEFVYLLDGYTLTSSYLLKGCKKPRKLYIHHYCIENLPQISTPTEINLLELFNEHLQEENESILSPFKTRGIILLKLNSICRGNTPIQKQTVELLQRLYEEDILPIIPLHTKRSQCGNTYHISAIGRVLLGEGEVLYKNERKATKEVFEELQIQPIQLQDPEYKSFIEGNEMNAFTIIDGYEKINKYLQATTVGISLALYSKGKITKNFQTHFFKQFTTKGMQKVINLIHNFVPRNKDDEKEETDKKEKKDTKEIVQIETDPILVDFICSFGRIFEIMLFLKELIPMELNGSRDQCFVVQRKEEIGISQPLWGIGGFSGIIAREIVGIAKELQCLCYRYCITYPLIEMKHEMTFEVKENVSKEISLNESIYESNLSQMKDCLHQTLDILAQLYKNIKEISLGETVEIETLPQLLSQIQQIEDDTLAKAIKFGDIKQIIRENHFDF